MRRTTAFTVAGIATVALMAAGMPSASAEIVPGVGMKGIKLDQKKKTVIRRLGQPEWIEKGTNDFGKFQVLHYRKRFVVNLENKFVVAVSTESKGQRTAEGVGVGSTKGQVKRKVDGVVCERIIGVKVCHVGDYLPGEAVTEFRITDRLVTEVSIGRVLD